MRIAIALSTFLAIVFGSFAAYLAISYGEPAVVADDDSIALLDSLETRLESIEARLDSITKLESKLTAIEDRLAARTKSSPQERSKTTVSTAPLHARGEEPGPSAARLEELIGDARLEQQLKDYVARVYYEEREARKENEKAAAEEKRRERAELSEGPYGKNNYKVNSMARKLGLSQAQKDTMNGLLTSYSERRSSLRKEIMSAAKLEARNPGEGGGGFEAIKASFKEVEAQTKALDEGFEREFAATLTPAQRDIYNELPDHERRGRSGGSSFSLGGESIKRLNWVK